MCGEHHTSTTALFLIWGSSPRVRGTRRFALVPSTVTGIIPACAGNTTIYESVRVVSRDHPRVCGEHNAPSTFESGMEGSSPRVRGTPIAHSDIHHIAGIIPACAGNTGVHLLVKAARWDHPRVCGEHAAALASPSIITGSSPRVRGTPAYNSYAQTPFRIIPACAGNTRSSAHPCRLPWDHPRVCGEHYTDAELDQITQGSSPRVRGTRGNEVREESHDGIIPACAGNTSIMRPHFICGGDHPRVCGEHSIIDSLFSRARGSSPRVRGTLGR